MHSGGGYLVACHQRVLRPLRPPFPPSAPQGLFERHKLLVATQLCMRILKKKGELSQEKFDYLLRGPQVCAGLQV